jgi:transcriptional activator of cad operon
MTATHSHPPLRIGDWVLDPSIDTVRRGEEIQKLEPRTTRLLLLLAGASGAVVSVDRILTEVWSGVVVGPASVYQAVSRLRRLLGDTDPEPTYIATVPRRGYRLVAAVTALGPHPQEGDEPATALTRQTDPAGTEHPIAAPAAANDPAATGTDVHPSDPPRLGLLSEESLKALPEHGAQQLRARRLWLALAVLIAAAAVSGLWLWLRPRAVPAAEPASVVVLPFVDMTADHSNQAFCDGLTEELSNWLAQIPSLRVVARTSAFAYLGRAVDVRTIGQQLHTTHVLEGSVRRSGSSLRVTAQLINAQDGYHVWSASFDRPTEDVVQVQEEISRAVADNLQIRLTEQTGERFAARSGVSPQAYQIYLLAGQYRHALTRESNDRAIEQYRQALAVDEHFALAYAGLAWAYLNQAYLNGLPLRQIEQQVEPLLSRGFELNPQLPELFTARGALRTDQGRTQEALADLRRATELNPNNSQALSATGYLLLVVSGQPREALQSYTLAARLDPLDYNLHARRCVALTDMAQFDEAEAACTQARALAPQASWPFIASSWLDWARGRPADALHWNELALRVSSDVPDIYDDRANLLLSINLPAQARAVLQRAGKIAPDDPHLALRLAEVSLYEGGVSALREQLARVRLAAAPDATTLIRAAHLQLLAGDVPAARALLARIKPPEGKPGPPDLNRPWYVRQGESGELTAALVDLAAGDHATAERRLSHLSSVLAQMHDAGLERYGLYTLQAQVLAAQGDSNRALEALEHAAALGWRATSEVEHDPALATLQQRGDFQALLQRLEGDTAAVRTQEAGRPANN